MLRSTLAVFLGVLALAAACREPEEDLPEPSPTTQATPAAGEDATTPASPGPTVVIPDDWQTYEDPKGRFSLRIPPDWKMSPHSSEDNPTWLEFNIPGENELNTSHTADGVKLSVSIEPKQAGESLESKAPDLPEQPRLTLEAVTVNGTPGVRAQWGAAKGFGEPASAPVGYVFERGSNWIVVTLRPVGPRTPDYYATFDQLVIQTLMIS